MKIEPIRVKVLFVHLFAGVIDAIKIAKVLTIYSSWNFFFLKSSNNEVQTES